VLVQLGITVADPTGAKGRLSEYRQASDAFRTAATARPFGDRERSIAAAEALADWADAVSQDMRGMSEDPKQVVVDGAMALRLLHQLGQMAAAAPLDYDSARQIAWAFRTIYEETRAVDPAALPTAAIDPLVDALFEKSHLRVTDAGKQVMIVDSLPERLRAVFDFDTEAFQAQFAELARQLP
jgi:hypothetical protein